MGSLLFPGVWQAYPATLKLACAVSLPYAYRFGDRPFLPFEVGHARSNALISLALSRLTTEFGGGSAVNEPIFAVLNQLANLNGLKGQLINLASTLRRTGPSFRANTHIYTETTGKLVSPLTGYLKY